MTQLRKGVGYVPSPAVSIAGGGRYNMDLTAHPTHHTPGSPEEAAALAKRYGPKQRAGVKGTHVPADYLRQAFADRKAWWPVNYDEWDGVPNQEEADDLYYTGAKVPPHGQQPATPGDGSQGFGRDKPGKPAPQPPVTTPPTTPAQPPAPQPVTIEARVASLEQWAKGEGYVPPGAA